MKTYLFDFDGTLVDSMPVYGAIMLGILDENRIGYGPDLLKITTPLGYRRSAEYFRTLGMRQSVDEIVETITCRAVAAYAHDVPAKTHVPQVLRALKARGDDLNVLTASPHAMLDPCLRRLGLYDLFTNVWSCEDFGTTKADPAIYRMAAERIGRPVEEIIFLDDNLGADRTAKAAGMRVCGVYDAFSAEYAQEIRSVCDAYIDDFSQLEQLSL